MFDGQPPHPVAQALVPIVREFALPRGALPDDHRRHGDGPRPARATSTSPRSSSTAIASPASSASCRRRSSATRDPSTLRLARDLGIAFQLTNICRDVGEDARRGRIYLPQEDLRASASRRRRSCRARTEPRSRADGVEFDRARDWYDGRSRSCPARDRKAQRTGLVMAAIYRTLLDEIERDGYRVLDARRHSRRCASCGSHGRQRRASCGNRRRLRRMRRGGDARVQGRRRARCSKRRPCSAGAAGASSATALRLDNGQHLLLGAYAATLGPARHDRRETRAGTPAARRLRPSRPTRRRTP